MKRAEFDVLYREHYHRVLGLCRRMLGGVADAEDATQEVFMRGYRAFERYRSDEPFGPWIGAIASNHCVDLLRRRRRLDAVFNAEPLEPSEVPDPMLEGVARLISDHEADAISRAVDALPEQYRLPIVLAYYADSSYGEIADALQITPNHVGVLLLRGRQRLRRYLSEDADFETDSGHGTGPAASGRTGTQQTRPDQER